MESRYRDDIPKEVAEKMNEELGFGKVGDKVPFDQDKMEKALKRPEIKEVAVVQLRKGMILTVNNSTRFKVIAVRANGKATIKPLL